MNERHFLLKCVTPIKSNRNHSICFSLLFPFPFSSSIWILISSAPSWPVWRMLLWSASGQKCFLILFTALISVCESYNPPRHTWHVVVLFFPCSWPQCPRWHGVVALERLQWPLSPLATHTGAQLGIRAGGARTTFSALMWVSRAGIESGTHNTLHYCLYKHPGENNSGFLSLHSPVAAGPWQRLSTLLSQPKSPEAHYICTWQTLCCLQIPLIKEIISFWE